MKEKKDRKGDCYLWWNGTVFWKTSEKQHIHCCGERERFMVGWRDGVNNHHVFWGCPKIKKY